MIGIVRELFVREASLEKARTAESIKSYRAIHVAHHVVFLGSMAVAFIAIAFDLARISSLPLFGGVIGWGTLVAFSVLLISIGLRKSPTFLQRTSQGLDFIYSAIAARQKADFLFREFIVILIAFVVFVLLFAKMSIGATGWVSPGDSKWIVQKDSLILLLTFAGGFLGAQLGLLTFTIGNQVGRYSSRLALAVVFHPAFLLLLAAPLLVIVAVLFAYFLGMPDSTFGMMFYSGVFLVFCMVLNVWSSLRAIATDDAVIYAGHSFAKRIRRRVKLPYSKFVKENHILWRCLQFLGLDFRDLDRLIPFEAPRAAVACANKCLVPLLNAAHRAIAEEQQEVFAACLVSIDRVARAYVKRRKFYRSGMDPVLRSLNDQLAALLKASTRCANESLIAQVVTLSGHIGTMSYEMHRVEDSESGALFDSMDDTNSMAPHYYELLKEGFNLAHSLKRSTAASYAIVQMRQMAIAGVANGFAASVHLTFHPAIEAVHQLCLTNRDAYHEVLASECFEALLNVWLFNHAHPTGRKTASLQNERFCSLIARMGASQLRLSQGAGMQMKDVSDVLVLKRASDMPTLQDIFLCILATPKASPREHGQAVEAAVEILNLVSTLGAVPTQDNLNSEAFATSLYECGLISLRRASDIAAELAGDFDMAMLNGWQKLARVLFTEPHRMMGSGKQALFSLLGFAMSHCHVAPRQSLIDTISGAVNFYCDLLQPILRSQLVVKDGKTEKSREGYAYLMLLGSWTAKYFVNERFTIRVKELLIECVECRYEASAYMSDGLGIGRLGYPVSLHGDFRLLRPGNVDYALLQDDRTFLANCAEELLNEQFLVAFASELPAKKGK